jgi:hypothetical protein
MLPGLLDSPETSAKSDEGPGNRVDLLSSRQSKDSSSVGAIGPE